MLTATSEYFQELVEAVGRGWNYFWYEPHDGACLIWLRQVTAAFALWWLVSFTPHLESMFGENGWVSLDIVHATTTDGNLDKVAPGFSPLFYVSSTGLWVCHLAALAIVAASTFGFRPRVTTPLTLLVVLCYVHRAPLLCGSFETALCMLLLYLCFAPKQSAWSLWRSSCPTGSNQVLSPTWLSNVGVRLIQVHVCALYLLIATTKLGTPTWWSGMATWHLLVDANHRLINLESLAANDNLMDVVSHGWVAFELLFPVLIWVRVLRPLLLIVATIVWLLTALVTGQIGYCLLMAFANLVFVSVSRIGEKGQ